MRKQEILDRINEIIQEEKGHPIGLDDLFTASELDSLGISITLMTIDSEFPIFQGMTDEDVFAALDIPTLTMRNLVNKCKLASTVSVTELNDETVI